MRNTFIIWRKEMRSYFVSPVAYLLLAMFGVIFGFFFWNILNFFVTRGMESQMSGEMYPMNVNEQMIRPLLSNVGVIGLFFRGIDPIRRHFASYGPELRFPLQVRKSRLETARHRVLGLATASRGTAGGRNVYFHTDEKPDHRWRGDLWRVSFALGSRVGERK